jgi:hypothetical protein
MLEKVVVYYRLSFMDTLEYIKAINFVGKSSFKQGKLHEGANVIKVMYVILSFFHTLDFETILLDNLPIWQ